MMIIIIGNLRTRKRINLWTDTGSVAVDALSAVVCQHVLYFFNKNSHFVPTDLWYTKIKRWYIR